MRKVLYSFILLSIFIFTANSSAIQPETVSGKWKYEVKQAPYGYQKGVLEITEKKDTLTGFINFDSGQRVPFSKMTIRNDSIWADIYVENEFVELEGKMIDSQMNGSVSTSMGKMDFEADKIVEK